MSNLKMFMKKNKKVRENVFFEATKSLLDENGEILQWEVKPLSTKDDESIKEECTHEVQVKGKPNQFRPKMNITEYLSKMLATSVVFPDLSNAELQDSYGVKTPEELLKEMIDDPGEYNDFGMFVQKLSGFEKTIDEKVDEVKN